MKKRLPFRDWVYFRTGWSVYFAFIFAAVNTLVVTYYLAIEQAPFLKTVFPTFAIYVAITLAIGLPLLVLTGFFHYRKTPSYKSEAEVNIETNPYTYKISPGHLKEVYYPSLLFILKILTKTSNNGKLSDDDLNEFKKLAKKINHLLEGGYVGLEGKQVSFGTTEERRSTKTS